MELRRIGLAGACAIIVLLLAYAIFGERVKGIYVISGQTMGTTYTVRIADCPPDLCKALEKSLDKQLIALNKQLSHYDSESEVSAFNRHKEESWVEVSAELYTVVSHAQALSQLSSGAFDITIAPAVNAWGFGPVPGNTIPADAEVSQAVTNSGYQKLALRANPPALKKRIAELQLDLSAIAKGFAVDQLALELEAQGLTNYLVEIGGEIRVSGTRPNGRLWRIGLEPPADDFEITYIVTPGDQAIASSGDYRNFFVAEGRRFAHTLDPSTGRPVQNDLAGVSVIQPSAMQADALATLLMVMGPERGLNYARTMGLPAIFFIRGKRGIIAVKTQTLDPYLLTN